MPSVRNSSSSTHEKVCNTRYRSGVAVHPAKEVVDTEIGEEDGCGEYKGVDVVGTWTAQERETGSVHAERGDQKGDQRPGFLRPQFQ